MNFFVSAYSKRMPNHRVFNEALGEENVREDYTLSTLNGKAYCWPFLLENGCLQNINTDPSENGEFITGISINVAANLALDGSYRIHQEFTKDEIILMLASVIKKSEVLEVCNKIWNIAKK